MADFNGCSLRSANAEGAVFWKGTLERADLRGIHAKGANFKGVHFNGSDLSRADMRDAKVWKADFTDTILAKTDFRGSELGGSKFSRTDLRTAKMKKTLLWQTRFSDVVMTKAQCAFAKKEEAIFSAREVAELDPSMKEAVDGFIRQLETK